MKPKFGIIFQNYQKRNRKSTKYFETSRKPSVTPLKFHLALSRLWPKSFASRKYRSYLQYLPWLPWCHNQNRAFLCNAQSSQGYYYSHHRDCSAHIETTNMHCWGIACTRSFEIYLTSAEGQTVECFK
jgi:hypothetical protein